MSSNQLLFIHIPKTAGTSFRLGLAEALGEDSACYDYGESSAETSDIVKTHCYENIDFWRFQAALKASDYKFVGGHFLAQRFVHIIGALNTISFIREPSQRILSEFQHYVRHHGYGGSLKDFVNENRFKNRQHRLLQGAPLSAYGYIGLTEAYEQSVAQINRLYGLAIPVLQSNVARPNLAGEHDANPDILEEIAKLNEDYFILYRKVVRLHQARHELNLRGQPFTRGELERVNRNGVFGWAVRDGDESPVRLSILVNDNEVAQVAGNDSRPLLKALGMERGGYIGFHIPLPKLKAGDTVRCLTLDTQQELLNSPLKVSKQHL